MARKTSKTKVKKQFYYDRFSTKDALLSSVGRFAVMKRVILMMLLTVVCISGHAQSPVEDLVEKYKKYSGATCVDLSGLELKLARPALLASPLAPVASDVDKLIILHMSATSHKVLDSFEKSLYGTLGAYDRFGVHASANGPVEVYARFSDTDVVCELVIFNPTLYVLNDIHGEFSVKSLKKLK